ncbi:MAG: T9SS C-terminal target domain-containing protein [Bacteroidetes bacterium]|nr:MAG: T9SS C-terminal target domain-containing protein [Bacteroidota bacterium]
MRKLILPLTVAICGVVPALAQNKPTEARIKIVKEVNGQTTVIDTVITGGTPEEVHVIIQKLNPGMPPPPPPMPPADGSKRTQFIEIEDSRTELPPPPMPPLGAPGDQMIMIRREGPGAPPMNEKLKQVLADPQIQQRLKELNVTPEELMAPPMRMEVRVVNFGLRIEDLKEEDRDVLRKSGADVKKLDNGLAVEQLNFYPNPSNGQFNLSFTSAEKGDLTLVIRDVQGREVYTHESKDFSGQFDQSLDLSTESKGVYFLTLTHKNKSMTRKLVLE